MTQAISKEMIRKYNDIIEATRGTCFYSDFVLPREDITSGGSFKFFASTSLRSNYVEYEDEKWYIKTLHGITYIYWEWRCDRSRWEITKDAAKRYFGIG